MTLVRHCGQSTIIPSALMSTTRLFPQAGQSNRMSSLLTVVSLVFALAFSVLMRPCYCNKHAACHQPLQVRTFLLSLTSVSVRRPQVKVGCCGFATAQSKYF